MRKINRACHLLILGTAIFGLSAARAGTIFGGFEGASISPFWTVVGPGTVTLSNAVAFAGTQSVEIVSNFPQLDELTHDFGTDWQGSVSVYVQGASMCCGAQAGLQIEDGSQNWLAVLEQTTPTNFIARVQPGGNPPESDFPFTSSAGWHLFEVDVDNSGLTMKFDGSAVLSQPSVTSFQILDLTVWGGTGATAYFDNFSATASPEPATGILITAAMAVLVALRRRWGPA